MSPRSTPFSAYPTHSYGMPNGGSKSSRTRAASLHESLDPPGVAWSFPNGSMSTLRTFQSAGHSSRQFSFPFSIGLSPVPPHSHAYVTDVRSFTRIARAFPIRLQERHSGSNGIHPSGYGWRSRYRFTNARTSSPRFPRSSTIAFISGRVYTSEVRTTWTPGAKSSRWSPKSSQ